MYIFQNLESAPNIQLLYLQNNRIAQLKGDDDDNNDDYATDDDDDVLISGLEKLKHLKKIYLTRNKIQVLENLENNKYLEVNERQKKNMM